MAAKRNITIDGVPFELTDTYAEGHSCTALEAAALNQTRAENLGNNFRKTVKDAKDEAGNISDAKLAELQAEFAKKADEYVFSAGGGRTTDPVEKEARILAQSIVDGKIAEKGMSKKDFLASYKDKYDAKVAELMGNENVRKRAEKIVKERQNAAASIDFGDDETEAA